MFDWLVDFVKESGYLGVAFLMFAETVFPPIPSEIIMPLAGVKAAQDQLSLWGVIGAGTLGALFGNTFWYLLARAFGFSRFEQWAIRYGRLMAIHPDELYKAQAWFERHGGAAVGFGRVVPTIRSLISVPAGILKMRFMRFVFYSGIGTFVWTSALAVAGFLLGSRYDQIDQWLAPVANGVIAVLVLIYLYRVITYGRTRQRRNPGER